MLKKATSHEIIRSALFDIMTTGSTTSTLLSSSNLLS